MMSRHHQVPSVIACTRTVLIKAGSAPGKMVVFAGTRDCVVVETVKGQALSTEIQFLGFRHQHKSLLALSQQQTEASRSGGLESMPENLCNMVHINSNA